MKMGADGTYQLAVRAINQYDKKVNWAEHSALEKKSKFNVLRVEQRANSVTFLGQKLKNMDQYIYHFFLCTNVHTSNEVNSFLKQ